MSRIACSQEKLGKKHGNYIYIYTHTHTYIYTHIYIYICIYICIIDLQYYIGCRYTALSFNIFMHYKIITTIGLVTVCHHT